MIFGIGRRNRRSEEDSLPAPSGTLMPALPATPPSLTPSTSRDERNGILGVLENKAKVDGEQQSSTQSNSASESNYMSPQLKPNPAVKSHKMNYQSDFGHQANKHSQMDAIFIDVLGDKSGSMVEMRDIAVKEIYKLLKEQKNIAIQRRETCEMFLSLTLFNSSATTVIDKVRLDTLKIDEHQLAAWLEPDGKTRLIDTAIERLNAQNQHVKDYEGKNTKSCPKNIGRTFVLLTDGKDTDSRQDVAAFNRAMRSARANGTLGIFLAANQDAVTVGKSYGFCGSTSLTYEPGRAMHAYKALDRVLHAYTSNGSVSTFTKAERNDSV